MNEEGQTFEDIVTAIKNGRNVFITGGGGVGKSYTLSRLCEIFPEMAITSTTGISALNVGGQTIHSWAGVELCENSERVQAAKISKRHEKLDMLKNTKLLAIDEISMLDDKTFKYIDDVLSIVRRNPRTFGGIQVILIGDFCQLPPVKIEYGKKYCFESPLWNKLNLYTVNLTKVYRQSDKEFIETLNNIRLGEITEQQIHLLEARNDIEPDEKAVRLYPKKNEADSYNYSQYHKLPGEEKIFWCKDYLIKGNKKLSPKFDKLSAAEMKEYESFSENCSFPQRLAIKIGARVMLLANTDIDLGLVNGACGNVVEYDNKSVTVSFDNGVTETIKQSKLSSYKDGKVRFTRMQLPLRLAYACTIHKAQGQTFDKVFINLNSTFSAGQTYVALSRVTSLNGLYLKGFKKDKVYADPKVIEFYRQLKVS